MTWCKCLMIFLQKCCGKKSNEFDSFSNDNLASFQSTYTVRRISSFGQTIINENGEESEIGRHSSILTYGGESLPWTSKPAPVQPGVTQSDILNQIKKLPTINETPRNIKTKHKWKKADSGNKKDFFPKFYKDNSSSQDLLLLPLKRNEKDKKNLEYNSVSQGDIFSKCKNKIEEKSPSTATLAVPAIKGPIKSVSSPDLVHCDSLQQLTDTKACRKPETPTAEISKGSYDQKESQDIRKEQKLNKAERLAKLHGLDLSLYTEEALHTHNIKTKSSDITKIVTWVEEPAGILDISLNFNSLQKLLTVTVNAIQSLCGEGIDRQPFSSIIKLALLSKKKIIKTSKEIIPSMNMKVDQVFSFSIKDIDSRAIRFSVYNAQWQGKYDAVGHSLLPIHDNLRSAENLLLKLYSQSSLEKSIGMMQISFGYDGIIFRVTVEKIFNFDPKIIKHKLYVKIIYYSFSKRNKEKFSPLTWTESRSDEINFNYTASFKIDPSGKYHSFILISVKSNEDHTMFKQDKTLGRVILGPYFYSESGNYTPWGKAIINKQNLSYSFKIFL